jgi:hypothetical protein
MGEESMVRVTSLSRIVFITSAALIIAPAALAQTSPSAPISGSSSTLEAPKKSEGLMARAKAKTQARITRMRKNWAEARFRTQTCRRQADGQNVAPENRAEFVRDCVRRMAEGKGPAPGPNVLPALFVSPEALKPNLGGMSATGDGGAMIDHGGQKKK